MCSFFYNSIGLLKHILSIRPSRIQNGETSPRLVTTPLASYWLRPLRTILLLISGFSRKVRLQQVANRGLITPCITSLRPGWSVEWKMNFSKCGMMCDTDCVLTAQIVCELHFCPTAGKRVSPPLPPSPTPGTWGRGSVSTCTCSSRWPLASGCNICRSAWWPWLHLRCQTWRPRAPVWSLTEAEKKDE